MELTERLTVEVIAEITEITETTEKGYRTLSIKWGTEKYPRENHITVFKDKAPKLDAFFKGDKVKVKMELSGEKYKDKVYNKLFFIDIESV
jgi:hypothetical protein